MEDAELVRACLAGATGAWERLVRDHARGIGAVARRVLSAAGRGKDEDAVEEVRSRVYAALLADGGRLLARYRPQFRLSTYLGVIARTHANRWLRALPRGAVSVEEGDAVTGPPDLARAETLEAVRAALESLASRDRLTLSLFYYEGKDYQAIAGILGVSINSVGAAITRARRRLAALLGRRVHEAGPPEAIRDG
ncbi:MAG: sigma-70 family RNA polymerase sigma factor [Planctomycetes bacterium]|nr:sigma-70 family RNA polymerase sigma factor [Planctomycetota bacterium]